MTYGEILEKIPDSIVVVAVSGRNKQGVATDFIVLDSTAHKAEALTAKDYFNSMGFEASLVETYQNKSVSVVKMIEGKPFFEPLLSPAENAQFFRSFFGID